MRVRKNKNAPSCTIYFVQDKSTGRHPPRFWLGAVDAACGFVNREGEQHADTKCDNLNPIKSGYQELHQKKTPLKKGVYFYKSISISKGM